ncbi:type VII secretion integral membrane protein EccD [Kutzneria kofuensis]|uniref:Type VII secretion integral membrane protein EccD n=1 Tax=Kutzneria kofuensis TaxID=103725 RepID=A0A7W9KPG7_9PSEU|nr:type VII secretion integral membrane protein EccD [Kutzneria kofuensis]MBB5896312.1 type VII secretion integral membrane protein EccD [Kutzneria kofuensis]
MLGDKAVDVALPDDVQLVDLLPSILAQFGKDRIEESVDHEGWVAQRLGEPPLDEDRSPAELNLVDGDTVYLRPRGEEMAPLDYDDLVDGVAERVRADAGRWSPDRTRWMLRVAAAAALLTAPVVLLVGPHAEPFWPLPFVLALAMVVGAAGLARAKGKVVDATLLAVIALGYAGVAGWLGARALDSAGPVAIRIVCAVAGTILVVVLALVAVADSVLVFIPVLVFAVLLLVPAVIWASSGLARHEAAAIGIAVNLVLSLFAPGTAFRLGGLRLPMLPTESHEVREDIEPVPHQVVLDRSAVVFGYLKALYLGYGGAQAVLLVALTVAGGQWPLILAGVCALLLFLRSRHLNGVVPRSAVLAPAACTVLAVALRLAFGGDPVYRVLAVLTPLVAVGAMLLVLSTVLPGKRLRPYWGRAVDILEYATAIAVLPVLLAVLDVYAWVRGLSG